MRMITGEIRRLSTLGEAELGAAAKELGAPLELVRDVARTSRLPVVLFCAGGIATPADAALMMALGAEGVFVGSGIFKSEDPPARARAIVEATTHWQDAERVAAASRGLGPAMESLESSKLEHGHLGAMAILARRNAFGRQIRSFEADLEVRGLAGGPLRAIFIRAPWIAERGPGVEVLAEVDGHPVAARQDNLLALAFHSEL